MWPLRSNLPNRNYIIVQDEKRIQEMTEVILKAYKKVLHSLNPLVMGMIRILDKSGYEELSGMKLSFQRLLKE
ncbi:MAG: hypothetical protein Q4G58_09180 [bacterium]|nr:hypothetical protein [bacterium]